jgi:chromosome segregation ATPase
MAHDDAIGFSIDIPDKVFDDLNRVDEKISGLQKTADATAKAVSNSFKEMSNGVNPFLEALKRANEDIAKLSKSGIGDMSAGMNKTTEAATQMANSIVGVTTELNKMDASSMNIAELTATIKGMNEQLRKGSGVDRSDQQMIVNKRAELKEELKLQELSTTEYERNKQKEAEAAERAAERKLKAEKKLYDELAKSYREQNKARNTTYEGSLAFSQTANTINREVTAIKYLTEARNNLSKTDANYNTKLRTLNDAINKHNKSIREATAGANEANKSHRNLMDTAGQLQRRLALVFSVSQVYGYIKNLVQVRAEFELQNRALAALLQNKDKANQLFAQITELAIKSPFTVKELVTYTKQLAAYQFESEKLYDTTKRLADVSAGLGVEMGRLILALGQVKAANYLRGTEVRQFTEAGFNILGELAKYYQELEGRMVSVAEVQERVTKRMVSFGDVEEIFKRVTDAGGLFYNMQLIQAETLSGQISNLRDSIDIMFNEIGKANDGALKDAVAAIRNLVENWETFAIVLRDVGIAFLSYKTVNLFTSSTNSATKALRAFIVANDIATSRATIAASKWQLLTMAFKNWEKALISVGRAIKSIAPMAILFAGLEAVYGVYMYFNNLNKAVADVNKEFQQSKKIISDISKAYDQIGDSAEDYGKKLSELSKLKDYLEGKGLAISIPIELVTPENIDDVFKDSEQVATKFSEFGAVLGEQFARGFNAAQGSLFGLNLFGDNLDTDLAQLDEAYSNIGYTFKMQADNLEMQYDDIASKLTPAAKQYYDVLKAGQKENDTDVQWQMRRIELMRRIYNIQNNNLGKLISGERTLRDLEEQVEDVSKKELEAKRELTKVFDSLIEVYGGIEEAQKAISNNPMILSAAIDARALEKSWSQELTSFVKRVAAEQVEIPVYIKAVEAPMPQFTNDFKDTLKALDAQGLFKNSIDNINSLLDLQNSLMKMYKQNMEELEVLNQANTEQLDLQDQIAEAKRKVAQTTGAEQLAVQAELDNLQRQKQTIDENIKAAKENIKLKNEEITLIARSFNLKYQEQKTAKDTNNIYKEQLSLIKQMGEAYKKYRQYYSEAESNELVRKEFSQAAQDAGIGNLVATMTFDASGIIAGLEEIGKKGGASISKEVNKSIADLKTEVNIEVKKIDVENVSRAIDDMFARYDFGKELGKLGIGKELGSQIFGIDAFNLDELSQSIEAYRKSLGDVGTEFEKQFAEAEKKVTKMQEDEYTERLKKYAEYLKQTIDDRVAAEYAAQQQIAKLQEMDELTSAQKRIIRDAINEEKDKKLTELEWKDFQGTDMYISLFQDMENQSSAAIDVMLNKLKELQESLKNLSPEQLKAIQEQINKLEDEQMQRNPFKNLGDNLKGFIDLLRQRRELEEQLEESSSREDVLSGNVKSWSQAVAVMKQQYDIAAEKYGLDSQQATAIKSQLDFAEQMLNTNKEDLGEQRKKTAELLDQLTTFQEMALYAASAFSDIGEIFGTISSAIDDISSGLENMGVDMDSTFGDILESVSEISSGIQQTMQGASTLAMGIATGNVVQGIQGAIQTVAGLFKTIGSIFAIGDKSKERQIQREQEAVEKLEKAYERLQEAQLQATNISADYSALEAQQENIEKQIASYERMIQLEKDKKKTDQGKIDDWKEQIEELRKEQAGIEQDFIQGYGGFGDNEAQKDAASEFIDVWLDAFRETGDGLDALKDKWAEYFDTILKKQMMMKAFEKYMEPVMDYIDDALEDGEFTVEEWQKAQALSEEASAKLNEFLKMMADQYGVTMDVGESDLSGLSKGIQSVTEETALALESILNSMRFFVSDSNAQLKSILAAITSQDTMQNPILGELKTQTALLRSINSFFGSVIASGDHPYGGKFIKVAF